MLHTVDMHLLLVTVLILHPLDTLHLPIPDIHPTRVTSKFDTQQNFDTTPQENEKEQILKRDREDR
jgi:hypothetical protein